MQIKLKTIHKVTTLLASLLLALSLLILSLNLPTRVNASPANQAGREAIGLASTPLTCLAVGDDAPVGASGVVKLNWQGQAESARLILKVTGAEARHTIKINGQAVAQVPIQPEGRPCSADEDSVSFFLDLPLEVVAQGNNLIEITNDALVGDAWTAAMVRLEVQGQISLPPPDQVGPISPADVSALATSITFSYTNPYDSTSQEARATIPTGYDGSVPTPLLIAVHPRNGDYLFGEETFSNTVEAKDWLMASPQLHGHSPIDPEPRPPGAYAYASLESQYDIIGAVNYMVDNYNVDPERIYIVGYSMGAQVATVTAAKFPHLFAALFDNKGPTDMYTWYFEQVNYYTVNEGKPNHDNVKWMRRECHIDGAEKTPTQNPFCYQRRSSLNFATNFIHTPISITHSISDALVPFSHSTNLRNRINSYGPDQPVNIFAESSHNPAIDGGPPGYHSYVPGPLAVLNFLEPFQLNNNPTHINITTDESKSFYWLNITQTGGDHWTQVEATYNPATRIVTAIISDTYPLTLGFNLGSTALPSTDVINEILQPGMGFPAGVYQIQGGGNNYTQNYSSGYLTIALSATGQYALTIALDPSSAPGSQIYFPVVIK